MGFDSRLVTLFPDPRGYEQDICLHLPFIDFAPTRVLKRWVSDPQKMKIVNTMPRPDSIPIVWQPHTRLEKILVSLRDGLWRSKIERAIRRYHLDQYDVYHLDGGLGLYRNALFIKMMKARGAQIICCYTGSDLRTRGVIADIDRLADVNVTVEYDHTRLHPDIHFVFFPFDTTPFNVHHHHNNERPVRIGHAPTNRAAKGSDIIIPVLQTLSETDSVEMILIEGLTYKQALQKKNQCDIFVDQLGELGYGINSLEALAMGIPVCTCLVPGFSQDYPDHPFIEVNAENLQHELKQLIHNPRRRINQGLKGKGWLQKFHNAVDVVGKIHHLAGINL